MGNDPLLQNSTFFFERSDSPSVDMIDKHIHNLFELYYLEKGDCRYFIDDRIYTIRPGDILLIPKGIFHKTTYTSKTRCRTVINFSSSHVPASILQMCNSPFQIRCSSFDDEVRFYLRQIEKNHHSKLPYSNELLCSSLEALLFTLFRNLEENRQVPSQKPLCYEILQYIQSHYAEQLTLPGLAKTFSISQSYLGKILKKECGIGFSEYLGSVRLQNARKLLLAGGANSITNIAYACGFTDSNYFSTCFKRAFGVSPISLRTKKGKRD